MDEGREPLQSTLGKIGLRGWEEALKGACPGETRLVFIPYELVSVIMFTILATYFMIGNFQNKTFLDIGLWRRRS